MAPATTVRKPLRLSDFGVSATRGFLSDELPIRSFPEPYFAPWDALITKLPELISSRALKREIASLSVLSASRLSSEVERRRAYVVLGFLIHAYVWGSSETPTENVPPQLSEPFLAVCEDLGLPPVLSYAGLCLWNWVNSENRTGLTNGIHNGENTFDLDNLETLASFTGTRGEAAFYLVPVLIEADGGQMVSSFLEAIEAAERDDVDTVVRVLKEASNALARLNRHLRKLFSTLDADFFFHQLRPFLAGGKNMGGKGLSRGMVFQKSDGTVVEAQYVGGSAVQSSLFPFLDIALGVEHAGNAGVLFKEMRYYMPGSHRQFLDWTSRLPTIRSFVLQSPSSEALNNAFNECLGQLRSWRGQHIAIVSKYVVQPSRASQAGGQNDDQGEPQGTGGADLIPFLKQSKQDSVGIERGTQAGQHSTFRNGV